MKFVSVALILTATMTMTTTSQAEDNPNHLGYTFPDEWEKHQGTMMIFPANHSYGSKTKALRTEFANVAKAIAKNEPVLAFCLAREESECRKILGEIPNVTIHPGDYRIDWARDNAPMVLRNDEGKLATAGFRFNGWGKKYSTGETPAPQGIGPRQKKPKHRSI